MNMISITTSIGLLFLIIAIILSMELPDSGRDPQTGLYSLHSRHEMDIEHAVRFWIIRKLAGDSGIMLNVRVKWSKDGLMHINGFNKGSLTDEVSADGPITLSPIRSGAANADRE
jgi:hypothetical protein